MTAIPDAAQAIIRAALDDYRLTTPPTEATDTGAARMVSSYLISSGYTARRTDPGAAPERAGGFPFAAYREIRLSLGMHLLLADPAALHEPAAQAARIVADLTVTGWTIRPNYARSAA